MNKFLLPIAALLFVGCGDDIVNLPDLEPRVQLLEANDKLQDIRLNALEARAFDLETRMSNAEDGIDQNEVNILQLFGLVANLDADLLELRDDLEDEVRKLERADRQTRRMIRRKVSSLRRALAREIRQRRLADRNLQDQIDEIEGDLNYFESRQTLFNAIISGALVATNFRITLLEINIQSQLNNLDNRLDVAESDIENIEAEVADIQTNLSNLDADVDLLQEQVVSVVYPCGEGNSEEVLLDTKDGLVAYFQETQNKTITFSDTVSIPAQTIPAHLDKFCTDTNFFNGECNNYESEYVGEHTIPAQTYNVGDSATVKVLKKAYLDVLGDGTYGTTDGYSCTFTISNGEVL